MRFTKVCFKHYFPNGLIKISDSSILPINENGGKSFSIRSDCSPKTIIKAMTKEVVCKVAWAIIGWHENVRKKADHVIDSRTCQPPSVLSKLFRVIYRTVILKSREQTSKWIHKSIPTKQFTSCKIYPGRIVKTQCTQNKTNLQLEHINLYPIKLLAS